MYVEVSQLESLQCAKRLRSYFTTDYVSKTRFHKKTSQVSAAFYDEFVQCCLMLFNKEQEMTIQN